MNVPRSCAPSLSVVRLASALTAPTAPPKTVRPLVLTVNACGVAAPLLSTVETKAILPPVAAPPLALLVRVVPAPRITASL